MARLGVLVRKPKSRTQPALESVRRVIFLTREADRAAAEGEGYSIKDLPDSTQQFPRGAFGFIGPFSDRDLRLQTLDVVNRIADRQLFQEQMRTFWQERREAWKTI